MIDYRSTTGCEVCAFKTLVLISSGVSCWLAMGDQFDDDRRRARTAASPFWRLDLERVSS